ncbi:MAG TPA: adenylyltransferase/cytidyltransferase family protein [Chthoniobacterales bacterium]|nr:adenylyltransferase/cytidyltransferase family protein [Chthoniobacterales bacterium]
MFKILPESAAATLRQDYAAERIVFTNGCFDILHLGHIRYLQAAKQLGGRLVVGLNSDRSVRAIKGADRPINNEADRAEVLAALTAVDNVIIFNDPRVTRLVKELRPQIYTKGGDYTLGSLHPEEVAALREIGAEIKLLPLVPGKSTTALLRAIQEK